MPALRNRFLAVTMQASGLIPKPFLPEIAEAAKSPEGFPASLQPVMKTGGPGMPGPWRRRGGRR